MKKINEIIEKYYGEFKNYLCIDNLEKFELKIIPYNTNVMAQTIKSNGIRYLRLNHTFVDDLENSTEIKKWKIGVLFHEFTHIADDVKIESSGMPKTKLYIYTPYKEFHAEQLKTLYLFGIYPFEKRNLKINPLKEIDSQYGRISIFEYIMKTKDGYYKDIKCDKMSNMEHYIQYYNMFCYYLGAASVYNAFFSYKNDEVLDISCFEDKLGVNATLMKNALIESVNLQFDFNAAIRSATIYIPMLKPFLI